MDAILVLAILVVLAIPVSIIALFVMMSGVKHRLAQLEQLVARMNDTGKVARDLGAVSGAAPIVPTNSAEDASLAARTETPLRPALPAMSEPVTPLPRDQIAAVSPWERALADAAPRTPQKPPAPPSADQDRRLVMRADRLDDLLRWLQGNWVYVVSAASLGLAGIFFVQYGVERGLLPPGLRVLAALAFGAGLVAAGEGLRRRHGDEGATTTVNLPSVFSGAGVVTLFAAVLAARQMYGLIGPGLAFAGHLGAAGLAIGLGWLSGPLLVAVGLIGAAAAPFIVGASSESVDWLYGYYALIAAVGLAVDAVRRWAWVSVLALVLGYGGGLLVQGAGGSDAGWMAALLALVALATTLPELRLIPAQAGPATLPALAVKNTGGWPVFPVRLVFGAIIASTIGLGLLALSQSTETAMLAMAGLAGLVLAMLLWAEKAGGLDDVALVPTSAFLAALAAGGPLLREFAAQDLALRAPETAPSWTASILLVLALLMSLAYAYRALRPGPWGVPYALAAVLTAPLAAAGLELFWQPARVLGVYVWSLHLIGLAALMTALALRFAKLDAGEMRRAAYATLSALSLIALALFVLTTKTALTLALAVLVVVAAALDRRFRLPEMSLFLQVGAAVLGYRLLADPGLNWAMDAPLMQVLLAFGGTIAAMGGVLWLLRGMERPMAQAVAESAAAGLMAILANVLISRWLTVAPDPVSTTTYAPQTLPEETHWGLTLNALPWLIFALMQIWRARVQSPLQKLRLGLAALGGLFAALGLAAAVFIGNPLFVWNAEDLGGLVKGPLVLDTLLLAYAVPGLMLMIAAWQMPGLGARLKLSFTAVGSALLALYTGLEIRRLWQGDWLGVPGVSQAELYTYTLALMALGAGLLYQAIAKRSDTLRRIAMAVIGLTVAKVFLLDAAGLTGLTRVVSFAGLGLSLAGLAWLNRWAERASDKTHAPPLQ